MVNRAEELITQLEAEIVKRDARVAELEVTVANQSDWLVEWEKARAEIERLDRESQNLSNQLGACGRELAALKAQPSAGGAVPDEWVMVPARMHLDANVIEAINYHCGDGQKDAGYGEHVDGLLWIGFIEDDEGAKSYGLNIATAEYPEEGSTQLVEFAAAPSAQQKESE